MHSHKYLYALAIAINSYYPILLLLNEYLRLYDYRGTEVIVEYVLVSNISLIFLYLTPSFRLKKLPHLRFRLPLPIIFLLCAMAIYNAPWHIDRAGVDASMSSIARALWLIYVWSNVELASPRRRFLLVVLTLVLAGIDGSRTYPLLTILPLIVPRRFSFKQLLYILFFIILSVSLVHFIRMSFVEDVGFTFNDLIFAALIGEAYWGSYGLSQIYQVGNPIFFTETLATIAYPVLAPLFLIFDPGIADTYSSWEIQKELNQVYFPMAGYNIHVQFFRYSFVGVFLFYIYILILREVANVLIPFRNFPYCVVFVFLSIKTSPALIMNLLLYITLISLILYAIQRLAIEK